MSPLLQQLATILGQQGQSAGSTPTNLTTDAQGNFLSPNNSNTIPASSFSQAAQQLAQNAGASGSGASGSLTSGNNNASSSSSNSSPSLAALLASIGTNHNGGSQQNAGGNFTL